MLWALPDGGKAPIILVTPLTSKLINFICWNSCAYQIQIADTIKPNSHKRNICSIWTLAVWHCECLRSPNVMLLPTGGLSSTRLLCIVNSNKCLLSSVRSISITNFTQSSCFQHLIGERRQHTQSTNQKLAVKHWKPRDRRHVRTSSAAQWSRDVPCDRQTHANADGHDVLTHPPVRPSRKNKLLGNPILTFFSKLKLLWTDFGLLKTV